MIVGHNKIFSYFKEAIEHDRLHHAYCFVGPESVGKYSLAKEVAANIFDVPLEKLAIQADFMLVEQKINDKTGKLQKDITIDQIRYVREFLSHKALVKSYKIAIINNVERMNKLAANALLKTLEEPKGKTALFLITSNPYLLPETILSRAYQINFSLVPDTVLQNYLQEQDIDLVEAKNMVQFAHGLPGRIMAWNKDPKLYQEYKKTYQDFLDLFDKPYCKKLEQVESLFGKKVDHTRQRQIISHTLGIWAEALRDMLKGESDKQISVDVGVSIYEQIIKTRSSIFKNIHPRLLVEHILLKIP